MYLLLLFWLWLQDILLSDGVELAALSAEISEELLLIIPVHLKRHRTHLHNKPPTKEDFLLKFSHIQGICFYLSG